MSRTHDDDAPVEHDPTGVRALLAGLPDPGPMPDDLVARITAALAAESAPAGPVVDGDGASSAGGAASEDDAHRAPGGATVVPLRRRQAWGHRLAVAAAVVGAVGVGGVALQATQGGLVAAFDTSGGSDSGAAAESETKADGGGDSGAHLAPEAGSSDVVVVFTDRGYTSAGLGTEAAGLATSRGEEVRDLAAESPGLGPIATQLGARTCADALGIPSTAGLLVDLGTVDGRPAAVLVATQETGRSAWAVDRSCTTGTTGLITGPVAVP